MEKGKFEKIFDDNASLNQLSSQQLSFLLEVLDFNRDHVEKNNKIRSYMNKLYKGKSEKTPSGQLCFYAQFFNEVEAIDDANNDEEVQEEITIDAYR